MCEGEKLKKYYKFEVIYGASFYLPYLRYSSGSPSMST